MSDEPPPGPWYDLDGFEIEFSFDSPPSAQSFEEMLREFRKAAGAAARRNRYWWESHDAP